MMSTIWSRVVAGMLKRDLASPVRAAFESASAFHFHENLCQNVPGCDSNGKRRRKSIKTTFVHNLNNGLAKPKIRFVNRIYFFLLHLYLYIYIFFILLLKYIKLFLCGSHEKFMGTVAFKINRIVRQGFWILNSFYRSQGSPRLSLWNFSEQTITTNIFSSRKYDMPVHSILPFLLKWLWIKS